MLSMLWQRWLNRRPKPCRRRTTAPRRCRLRLEALEGRLAPAVLTVNTTGDGSDPTVLSLRQAIQAVDSQSLANLSPQQQQQVSGSLGGDQIRFAPGLTGPLRLAQGELDITKPVLITGQGTAHLSIDAQQRSSVFVVPTRGINVTLDSLTITGGYDVFAGGIWNSGNLTVSNCTLLANYASLGPGGIYNDGNLMVSDCTLFDNVALYAGGSIANAGTATLTSVTVTNNQGGGVTNGGTLLLHNSIVAGNFLYTGGPVSDIVGTLDPNSSYNLIGTGGSGGLSGGVNHNLVGVSNPGLGPLADNGGPTQTCALLAGSPASGSGDPSLLYTSDQRGVVRTGSVSLGAYQDPPPPGSGGGGSFDGYPPWSPGTPGTPPVHRLM